MSTATITDQQIRAMMQMAAYAGAATVRRICGDALAGDARSRAECEHIFRNTSRDVRSMSQFRGFSEWVWDEIRDWGRQDAAKVSAESGDDTERTSA